MVLPRGNGHVMFHGVHFRYPALGDNGETLPTIHDFNLDVEPGTIVALVAATTSAHVARL